MDLVLTVIGCPAQANMLNHTKVFKKNGGMIGRADSNDWVLPDSERIVSSRHAEIQFSAGKFLLVDHSTNGTFVNEGQSPLGPGTAHEIMSGDVLNLGEYQLRASVKAPPPEQPASADLGAVDFLDGGDKTTFNPATAAAQKSQSSAKELDSWLDPSAPKSDPFAADDGWGAAPVESSPAERGAPDPWASASSGSSLGSSLVGGQEEIDPLSVLNRNPASDTGPSAGSWDDDDDWWKTGSIADNAPANQHQMKITPESHQDAPAFDNTPPPPPDFHTQAPDPFFASEAPQAPPAPPADNPFAASDAGGSAPDDIDSLFGIPAGAKNADSVNVSPPVPPAPDPFPPQTPQPPPPADAFSQAGYQTPPAGGTAESGSGVPPASDPWLKNEIKHAEVNPASESKSATSGEGVQFGVNELQQLATLLGLESISPEHLQQLIPEMSSVINETVTRLIDLLRARAAIKNELRVQHTMIQTVDNNPMKFSANAADAMKVMFGGDRSAFMRPSQAIQDSFDDLSDHQVAVLKGMNMAYEAMLQHFDPENLKRYIGARDSLLGNKDAKNWVAFEQYYGTLKQDYETTYNKLFGDEFARSYEKQLAELKNNRMLNKTQ
ncbi:MAG: type VI secretion system-associated FHA domain protein TagH [Oceanospirillaceae bacterium]|nr:type VI secretion system-associated FHA domain protein TagH [Oceanospirillaceae bacterium]MBT13971.1 type VI secretion system-associated FHA domain protein TagH [Oceanospirillaceae bacterium]|tara:strand:+ start:9655 stop:11478 length:1824 start_codon:yes stop_codon:yes gene_type:complete